MRFTAAHDLAAPIADAWAALTDIETLEAMARARNVALTRQGRGGVGTEWQARFRLRGAAREASVRIVGLDLPGQLRLAFAGELFEGTAQVDLVALARARTRLAATVELVPRTLAARLALASARLVKPRADRRFARGVEAFARMLAARARAAGG